MSRPRWERTGHEGAQLELGAVEPSDNGAQEERPASSDPYATLAELERRARRLEEKLGRCVELARGIRR